MKKKKSGNQPSADFKNNPFKPLKSFTPQAPSKKMPETAPQKKVRQSEDDSALFLRAVSGARRMTMDEETDAGPRRQPTSDKRDAALPEDRELFLKAMQKI